MYAERINELEKILSFTHGHQITDYSDGYICDVFSYIADGNVDIYVSDLSNQTTIINSGSITISEQISQLDGNTHQTSSHNRIHLHQ